MLAVATAGAVGGYQIYNQPRVITTDKQIIDFVAEHTALRGTPKLKKLTAEDISAQVALKDGGAQSDDILLIYSDQDKAVLFRSREQKIIGLIDSQTGGTLGRLNQDRRIVIIYHVVGQSTAADALKKQLISAYALSEDSVTVKPQSGPDLFTTSFVAGLKTDQNMSEDLVSVTEVAPQPIYGSSVNDQMKATAGTADFLIYMR